MASAVYTQPPASDKPASKAAAFQWDGFEQVRALQDHNTQLLQQVDAQNRELARLRETLDAGRRQRQEAEDLGSGVDAGQRIAQLSRRLRDATAKLEAEQARARKATEQCEALEASTAALREEAERLRRRERKLESRVARMTDPALAGSEPPDTPQPTSRADAGAEKQEVFLLRNQVQTLRKDVQMAHRALAKELGDDATVAQVHYSSVARWIRSQQCCRCLAASRPGRAATSRSRF